MASYASKEILKVLEMKKVKFNSKILILGYTFKENCPDFRNTQVEKIVNNLQKKYSNIGTHTSSVTPGYTVDS